MGKYFAIYVGTLVVFLALDYIWLAQVARGFYYERLNHLLLDSPKLAAAAGFYAVYVVGILYFAINPAIRDGSFSTALLNGALFGFFAYATYDMTNYATLRDWPVAVVISDVAWGTLLTAVSAIAGFWISRQL